MLASTPIPTGLLLLAFLPSTEAQDQREELEQIDIAMLAIGLAFAAGTVLFTAEKIIGRCTDSGDSHHPPASFNIRVFHLALFDSPRCFHCPVFIRRFWVGGLKSALYRLLIDVAICICRQRSDALSCGG